MMNDKRFELVSVCGDFGIIDTITDDVWFFETYEAVVKVVDLLNEQQEQLDLYKEAILTMLGLLADKGIIFSGVKDE